MNAAVKTCGGCGHAVGIADMIQGECRRFPPQVVVLPVQDTRPALLRAQPQQLQIAPVTIYPAVTPDTIACGEWVEIEPKPDNT
jgi:hypothetical protein